MASGGEGSKNREGRGIGEQIDEPSVNITNIA